ncbi:MAG: hypothetical protein KF724_00390 [Phycisphaeraceae bacterium]|nr:hypothetical protein [Phycisphaeraceae bacterium]
MYPSQNLRAGGLGASGVLLAAVLALPASANNCTCLADLSGDGEVNGADLALILGGWGTAAPALDLSGDGVVNGADIAIVLGAWGPCTTPVNDTCSSALLIVPGTYQFCTQNATTDGPSLPSNSCGQATMVHKDLWYQFAPQSNGTLTVETCGTATFDTVIAVYTSIFDGFASCPTEGPGLAVFVGCSDDDCGFQSKVTANVVAGKIYKIRVGAFAAGQGGSGALKVSFSHPGESCENSIQLSYTASATVIGTTLDNPVATEIPNSCFGGFPKGPGEWITFGVPCFESTEVTVTTCYPITDFDTVITILRFDFDFNCWTTFITCNDDSSQPGCDLNGLNRKSFVTFTGSAGGIYRVVISGFGGSAGNYQVGIGMTCNF